MNFVSLGIFRNQSLGLPGARFWWYYDDQLAHWLSRFFSPFGSIPVELYGRGRRSFRFCKIPRKITIPMLRPIIEFLLIMNIINGFAI